MCSCVLRCVAHSSPVHVSLARLFCSLVGTNSQDPEGDAVLSQEVHGKNDLLAMASFLVLIYTVTAYASPLCSPSLADRADHAVLLRKYVSRQSAGKGRAVLEAVGLDLPAIDRCYVDNPRSEEEAIQSGLRKWVDSRHATWEVLIDAMEDGGIAVEYIDKLRKKLKEKLQCEHVCLHSS